MKLYYSQGACSLSPHIALFEAGAEFQAIKVGRDKKTADGRDFSDINPYGYVPALEIEGGEVLLEGPAIVQYIADKYPEARLAPANGTLERYRLQSALGFINSELHKTASGLFNGAIDEAGKAQIVERLDTRIQQLSAQRAGKDWVANEAYSVADAYLYVIARWLEFFKLDLQRWPWLAAHHARVHARPAVQKALRAEQLIRDAAA